MVRFSARQALIREIQQLIVVSIAMSMFSHDHQADVRYLCGLPLLNLLQLYTTVVTSRYLSPRVRIYKRQDPVNYIMNLSASRFRQEARMDKNSFIQIVNIIKTHEIFINKSNHGQAIVELQFLVFLAKLGR